MHITFAAHTAESGNFRVGSHHLSRELAKLGCSVSHISTPVTPIHLAKVSNSNVRRRVASALDGLHVDENSRHLHVPFAFLPCNLTAGRRLNLALWTTLPLLTSTLGKSIPTDVLLIDEPLLVDIWCLTKPRAIIYRPTDVYEKGVRAKAQKKILQACDGIVATSAEVLSSLPLSHSIPTLILENGVEFDRFDSARRAAGSRNRAGVVYIGALDDRIDWDWLRAVATYCPDVNFTLAGPNTTTRPIRHLPNNVQLIGPVAYHATPRILAAHSVGLLPFKDNNLNRGRSPMKLYEYLAAGLHVVGTTSSLGRNGLQELVSIARDSSHGAELILALLPQAVNEHSVDAARVMDWSSRAIKLQNFCGSVIRQGRSRSVKVTGAQRSAWPSEVADEQF